MSQKISHQNISPSIFYIESQRDEIFFAQSAKKLSNDKILAVFLLLMMLSEVFFSFFASRLPPQHRYHHGFKKF